MICSLEPLIREEKRDENREMEIARKIAGKVIEKGYDLKTEPEAFKKIFQWIGQYRNARENPEYSKPAKGLLLVGQTGVGKTVAAKFISHFCGIQFYTMKRIDEEWGINPEGCKSYFTEVFQEPETPVIIDDLGAESASKHFNVAPVFEFMLPFLYDRWTVYRKPVIITTNLTMMNDLPGVSIGGCYGTRVKSRFQEMFTMVKFGGKDRRANK